jgi:hypothetical protein
MFECLSTTTIGSNFTELQVKGNLNSGPCFQQGFTVKERECEQ